ncbi:hypothetical protein TVNIR_1625 [Thioalkalivibrio nitratireducens DSM 14787]|uniref:Uncharacterized protein n=1 Tax=Thioalkalivibrio nitratireducens (strain DSM 14787 / UNIQEM 213 / ALEN2) TaxID=1255043 RepID=L0DY33_THIND|nr:hypothetical protein [Thioalkalivibrio nitratireducens]AGA33291.1 hypothetical protein TVNIR_1625 [Thioalkalivibrio nitratireducens DSM 14787]
MYRLFPRANPVDIAYVSLYKTRDHRLFGDMCIRPVLIFAGACIHDAAYVRIGIKQAQEVLKRHNGEVVIKRVRSGSARRCRHRDHPGTVMPETLTGNDHEQGFPDPALMPPDTRESPR